MGSVTSLPFSVTLSYVFVTSSLNQLRKNRFWVFTVPICFNAILNVCPSFWREVCFLCSANLFFENGFFVCLFAQALKFALGLCGVHRMLLRPCPAGTGGGPYVVVYPPFFLLLLLLHPASSFLLTHHMLQLDVCYFAGSIPAAARKKIIYLV